MRLDAVPYDIREHIAQHLETSAITTIGSACSAWRGVFQSKQRILCSRAGGSSDYAQYAPVFPRADTLRLHGTGLDLSLLQPSVRSLSIVQSSFVPLSLVATQLTSLELCANQLDAAGVATIAQCISEMRLVELAICNNAFGVAPAIEPLARSLARMALTDLALSGNRIGATASGAALLAPALSALTTLTSLRLAGNRIGREGATTLAPSLRALTRLVTLDLRGNVLDPEGVAALSALCEVTSLTSLNLQRNNAITMLSLEPHSVSRLLPSLVRAQAEGAAGASCKGDGPPHRHPRG